MTEDEALQRKMEIDTAIDVDLRRQFREAESRPVADPLPAPSGPRPDWDDYFLGLAFLASRRSPDLSTKHGCVIVDPRFHHVIGTGYNGYDRGVDDEAMARHVPKLYSKIRHSEVNAVDNCTINPRAMTGLRAYVTGQCCSDCAEYLADHGIVDWVMADRRGFSRPSADEDTRFARIVAEHGVTVRRMKPDLSWMIDESFLDDLRRNGLMGPSS